MTTGVEKLDLLGFDSRWKIASYQVRNSRKDAKSSKQAIMPVENRYHTDSRNHKQSHDSNVTHNGTFVGTKETKHSAHKANRAYPQKSERVS